MTIQDAVKYYFSCEREIKSIENMTYVLTNLRRGGAYELKEEDVQFIVTSLRRYKNLLKKTLCYELNSNMDEIDNLLNEKSEEVTK